MTSTAPVAFLTAEWTHVENGRGGTHHHRRTLTDGSLLTVSETLGCVEHASWRWVRYLNGRQIASSGRDRWATPDNAKAAAEAAAATA